MEMKLGGLTTLFDFSFTKAVHLRAQRNILIVYQAQMRAFPVFLSFKLISI